MTEPAATVTAPVAAPTSTPQTPAAPKAPAAPQRQAPSSNIDEDVFNSGNNFHEFQRLSQERFDQASRDEAGQPPNVSRETMEAPPETPVDPNAPPEVDPNADPLADPNDPSAVPPDVAAQQAAEQEILSRVSEFMKLGGEPPPELLEVPVTLPNGSVETWGEVMKGFMRRDDHNQGWAEANAIKERSEAAVGAYKQHFDQIEDPDPVKGGDAMYEVYTRGKRRAAAMKMAEKLAQDDRQDRLSAAGAAFAYARSEGLCDAKGEPLWNHREVAKVLDAAMKEREQIRIDRDMGRERDWENERLRKQNETRVNHEAIEANAAKINKQLDQLRPRAFKALGLLHDAEGQQLFDRKLQALVKQTGAAQLTPNLVMDAARMVRDHQAHEREQRAGAPKPKPKAFTPTLGAGGGPGTRQDPNEDLANDEVFARKFGIRSWQQ